MNLADSEGAEFSVTARRNVSLTASERRWVFSSLLALSLGISLAFAAFGAWPIAPFAGLEMAVLYLAFRELAKREGDYERIVIVGDTVTLETMRRACLRRFQCNRCWVQVMVRGGGGCGGSRVSLRSHGREVEFGAGLTEEKRLELARLLRKQLSHRKD